MDVYDGRRLDFYGVIVGVFDIVRHHFLIKRSCCPEVSVQSRAGVNTGLFARKKYGVKFVWWELGEFIIDL